MHDLKLLVLMVLLTYWSTNTDAEAQFTYSVPLNRLGSFPRIGAESNAIHYLNYKHLLPSNPSLRNYGSPKCLREGRIADPDDCGQYYDCVRGSNGDFIANKQSCFGHAFDATEKFCVPANLAKGCNLGSTNIFRSVPVDEPSLQTICKSHENEFVCMDCKTLIMCVDRKPYVIPCTSGNVCNNKDIFKGGVCYPDAPLQCTCDKDDIFRQDYYDKSKFLSCEKEGDDPVIRSCPAGLEFNELHRTCGTPIDTSCSDIGTFALKSDCKQYHTCIKTTSGWFQRNFTCTGNTMYNEHNATCEDPCDWYDGNFVCTEEGRFRNLKDCTTFFECITDPSDSNNFIRTDHVCPKGYEWLPWVNRYHCVAKGSSIRKCEPQKPNTCAIPTGWCPSETATTPPPPSPTTATTLPPPTTTAAITTTLPPPTSEDTILTPGSNVERVSDPHRRPSNSPMRPRCFSEGRIADPDNCGQYYDCVRGRNGALIANKQSCFGNAFDATREECVSLRKAKGCIIDSSDAYRSVTVDIPNLQKICKSYDNEFICMDCKTLIMCVDRQPHIIPCKSGNVCYNDKTSFKGGVCYPDSPLECTCNNEDIFKQDYYDPSKFLSCHSEGADPVVQSCPAGLEFNEQRSTCGYPIDTSCSESGTFAIKSDCKKYHTCIYTSTGWFQRNFTCTGNTMYNEQKGICEDPCKWYDGNFICKEEGRFPNPLDCTTFFECIKDPLDANKFLEKREHVCPEGYEWLPKVNRHHCVAKGSTKEKCVPQKLNTCTIPNEWCPSTEATTAPTPPPPTTPTTVPPPPPTPTTAPPPPPTTTTLPPPTPEELCTEAGGTMISEQCLVFSNGAVSCDVAKTTCSNNGWTLASIVDTQTAVEIAHSIYGEDDFWVGATTSHEEITGEGADIEYLYMNSALPGGYFAYQKCDRIRGYICEIDISTPVTLRRTCPHGHFQVGSQCFFIPTEGFKTWYKANELCMKQGGILAEPNSIPEFHKALSKETLDYGFWLGGSNRKQGGNWRWESRAAMVGNTDSWYPESTNMYDTSEKCLFLMRDMEKPLTARSCAKEHHYFICEKR